MAIATLTVNVYAYPRGGDNTQRTKVVRGTFAISTGGTYPPGGFPISWANVEGAETIPPGGQTPTSTSAIFPIDVNVKSVNNPPSGYIYLWDNILGNLHIFEAANSASGNSGPLLEVGGAIDNRIVTDLIQFVAEFNRN